MRVPIGWLREYAAIPDDVPAEEIAARLTAWGLKLEEIITPELRGPLVIGRVLSAETETHSNGKRIEWCRVDVGPAHNEPEHASRGIVCGAHNFSAGDLVVVSLPGTVLPGGFEITARKTYGHVSDGMICSQAELGLGTDHEGIIVLEPESAAPGADAIRHLGLDEEVLDLEVNPDRGYALSMRGVARDAALAFGVEYTDPAAIIVPAPESPGYPVEVPADDACPVFAAATAHNVDQSRPTPDWMIRRIEQSGMRAISLAVDITNYVMLELGQPIHGYDRELLRGPIVVRRANNGEKLTTLDGVPRTLENTDLLICDDRGGIGLAGVMGGQEVEISASTTDIVIEAANFRPTGIARTARIHKLPSEASKRFERGVDPALAERAAARVAELLVTYGGGTLDPGVTYVGEPPVPVEIRLDPSLPERISGVAMPTETVTRALRANGCAVERDDGHLVVTAPPWRFDLNDPFDLIEEVLRVVGYDRVPSVLPVAPPGTGLTSSQRLRRRVGRVLAGAGLTEVTNFPFAGPGDFDGLGIADDDPRRRQVMLENPLSTERPGMTTTLLAGLLPTLALNVSRGHDDVEIYEISRVFLERPGSPEAPIYRVDECPSDDEFAALNNALPDQPTRIGLVMAGNRDGAGWWGDGRQATWADPIQVIRRVAAALHVQLSIDAADYAPFHPGRCAAISCAGEVIGHAGELHPRVVDRYGVPSRTVAAEVDVDALIAAAPAVGPKPEFSAFPVAKEDLALVVDESVRAEDLRAALAGAHPLIEAVRLFDVYAGEQIGSGKKSLAFSLRLRAADRTLGDEDIRSVRDAAVSVAHSAAGAALRS